MQLHVEVKATIGVRTSRNVLRAGGDHLDHDTVNAGLIYKHGT